MKKTPNFSVYGASQIKQWLKLNSLQIFNTVRDTYLAYHSGTAENPDSYFLKFKDDPRSRIIALPGVLEDRGAVSGIKWIASFPNNIESGLDRASAVVVVNDRSTGYPLACLEGSQISSARTAASAAVGVEYLHFTEERKHISCLGVVGCGPIALASVNLMHELGWDIDQVILFDDQERRMQYFAEQLNQLDIKATPKNLQKVISSSDVVLFATSAITPYVDSPDWLSHRPTIIHLSLRDLTPNIINTAQNVADDIEHCLKASTSLHLTEQENNNRDFIRLNIADLISGQAKPDFDKPRIYSPFGMGVLDLAVARSIMNDESIEPTVTIPNFFPSPYVQ